MKPTATFLTWCGCLSIILLTTLPAAGARADSCPPAWTPGFPVAGIGGSVDALTVFDDGTGPALYAAGEFHAAGTVPAGNIAKWNGTHWSALGSGMNDSVLALTVYDDGTGPALYAGGAFTTAGGVPASHVAKWDGTQWSALGSGVNDTVYALTVFNDGTGPALFAGGRFTTAGGVPANRIAKWNPGAPGYWSALGSGLTGYSPRVHTLTVFDDGTGPALVAGGVFTAAGGTPAKNIAKWNPDTPGQWSALGSGVSDTVYALTVYNDGTGPALVAGGWFTSAGGVSANSVAKWRGNQWSALGSGMSSVYTLTVFDDGTGPALVAGGYFTSAGGGPANHIAEWDGAQWSALGGGIGNIDGYSDSTAALTVFDDGTGPALVAGGYFTTAAGGPADSIAQWDPGTPGQWSALGSGLNAPVNALTVFDDGTGLALFVGGSFISTGDVAANAIAQWNPGAPGQWSALGSGMSGGSYGTTVVSALAVFDDGTGPALYAGGGFTSAGGVPANHIAKWDGAQWSALGSGMEGPYPYVAALTVFDDGSGPALYACGGFTTAGGVPVNGIAKWNPGAPGQWSALGSGMDGDVSTLTVFDDGTGPALVAGGSFQTAGGVPAGNIAKWDGSTWSALGSGVQYYVAALVVFDDGTGPALIAGGSSGEVRTDSIARWDGAQWSTLGSGVGGGVAALTVFDDGTGPVLIAGGWFTTAGGEPADRIAKWDGTQWSTLGSGTDYHVYALTAFQDGSGPALYAGGDFATAGGIVSGRLARWGCQTSPADQDGDGIPNSADNCPVAYNPSQADCDSNGTGDACEPSATDCNGNTIPDSCDVIDAGDFDADGDVDLVDYRSFTDCLAGPDAAPAPPIPACVDACLAAFDAEADSDIDLADFGVFQLQMAGPPG
jgi:trimeric autotransporter adhesin